MTTKYPSQIDGYAQIRVVTDRISEIIASDHNDNRSAVIAIERTLGVNPQSTFDTVAQRLDFLSGGSTDAGGDLDGYYPNPEVVALRGRDLSTTAPTDGYALIWNASLSQWEPGGAPTAGFAGGDLTGTYPNPTLAKIQGRVVGNAAPLDGYVYVWNASASRWTPQVQDGYRLQNRKVSSSAPTSGYALTWNASTSQWESARPIPGGPAGGDLSGTYPNPTVDKLEGYNVSPVQPTDGYALVWNNSLSQWEPTAMSVDGYILHSEIISSAALLDGYVLVWNASANMWSPQIQDGYRLQNRAVSSAVPTNGYALVWSDSSNQWEPTIISAVMGPAGGDLSGTYPNPVVDGIQNREVSSAAPSDGFVYVWNASANMWSPQIQDGYRLQNRAVSSAAPTDGYALTWNNSLSQWESNKPIPGGAAGGDLSGTYPKPTVDGIQGRDIDSASPTDGYALTWNNSLSQWESNKPIPGGIAGGDLSGTYPKPTVDGIQGRAVSSTLPTNGYALVWNDSSSQWEPTLVSSVMGPAGGDLSGTYPNPSVDGIQGRDVSAAAPTDGYVYVWNASANMWSPQIQDGYRIQNRKISSDVPTDGYALIWDETAAEWISSTTLDGVNPPAIAKDTMEPTGFPNWDASQISLSVRTLTIQPAAGYSSFVYYLHGKKYEVSTLKTATFPNSIGTWWFHMDENGDLLYESDITVISPKEKAIVALTYWNGTENIGLAEERHGIAMDNATHEYLHLTVGTRYRSGLTLTGDTAGTGAQDDDAKLKITGGVLQDEDDVITIAHKDVPVAGDMFLQHLGVDNIVSGYTIGTKEVVLTNPQTFTLGDKVTFFTSGGTFRHIDTVLSQSDTTHIILTTGNAAIIPTDQIDTYASLKVIYRDNTDGRWLQQAITSSNYDFPFTIGATPRVHYNQFTGGSWTRTEVTNGDFVAYWIFGTNTHTYPVLSLMGQRTDTTLTNSQNNNTYEALSLGLLPFAEMKLLYRLIFQTSNAYGNTVKTRLREIVDFRSVSNLPSGTYVASAHAALTGLDYVNAGHTGFGRTPFEAVYNPSTTHDAVDTASVGRLFRNGDLWLNTTTTTTFVCVDSTASAAKWRNIQAFGANNYVQYYADGYFRGEAAFSYNPSTDLLTVGSVTMNTQPAGLSTDFGIATTAITDTLSLWSIRSSGSGNISAAIVADVNNATLDPDHKILSMGWVNNTDVYTELFAIKDGQFIFSNIVGGMEFWSDEADNPTAVAFTVGSENAWTSAGSKLLSIVNGGPFGVERAYIDYYGSLSMATGRLSAGFQPAGLLDDYGIATTNGNILSLWGTKASGAGNVSVAVVADVNAVSINASHKILSLQWVSSADTATELAYFDGLGGYVNSRAWGIATTATDGFTLGNTTAALVGTTIQYSPSIALAGTAWDTDDVVSRVVTVRLDNRPVSGAAPYGALAFTGQIGAGAPALWATLSGTSSGNFTTTGVITSGGYLQSGGTAGNTYVQDNTDRSTGLGASDNFFSTSTRVVQFVSSRTDGASNYVFASVYDRNAASITNAATMRIHTFGWVNNADAFTELAYVRADGAFACASGSLIAGIMPAGLTADFGIYTTAVTDTLSLWSTRTSGSGNISTAIVADVNAAAIDASHKMLTIGWMNNADTYTESFTFTDGQIQIGSTAAASMLSDQADSASSVAVSLGSVNNFFTPGAKLLSIINGDPAGYERAYIDAYGDLCVNKRNNEQCLNIKSLTELYVVPAAADGYSTIQIPANSLMIGLSARVNVTIPTASVFNIGILYDNNKYADSVSVAAGTTSVSLFNAIYYNEFAETIQITPDASPATAVGRVRLTIYYISLTAPTS